MPDRPQLLQIGGVLDTMAPRLAAGFEVTRLPENYVDFLVGRGSGSGNPGCVRG